MRLESLAEFKQLAHNLNFSAAARELNMTQPSLSRHIDALEREIKFKLFSETRKVHLTPAGKVYLDFITRMLDSHEAVLERCRALEKSGIQELRVLRPSAYDEGFDFLYKALRKYESLESNRYTVFKTSQNAFVTNTVAEGYVDLAVTATTPSDADDLYASIKPIHVCVQPLISTPLLAWIHKDNPLADKERITWEDIRNSDLVFAANRSFDYMRYACRDLLKASASIDSSPSSYAAGNLEEFYMYVKETDVTLVTEMMARHPALSSQDDRVTRTIDDDQARLIFFAVYQEDTTNDGVYQVLDILDEMMDDYQKKGGSAPSSRSSI